MKLRRLLSATLALLLVVSILPLGAFAEGEIEADKTVDLNEDVVNTNYGKLINNGTDGGNNEAIYVAHNAGTIENNYANVGFNNDLIEKNQSGGVVYVNEATGTIQTNRGTVGTYSDAAETIPNTDTGNQGEIYGNTGTVVFNEGVIQRNGAEATKKGDYYEIDGSTFNPDATVELNKGDIDTNLAEVTTNAEGGYIYDNSGNVGTNEEGAEVDANYGTIGTNSGLVDYNSFTQYDYEDDWVKRDTPAVVDNNSGTVKWNDGTVNNIEGGVVECNLGLGLVNNGAGGEVEKNHGLVENEAGGLLNDTIMTENPEDADNPYLTYQKFTGETGTYVGTNVDRGYIETTDETTGEQTSENFADGGVIGVLKQAIQGTVLNLKEVGKLFRQDGYEVIGYSTGYAAELALSEDDADMEYAVVYETEYTVKESGGWLSLIWKAITKPASSGGSGNAGPAVLNRLSEDKVRVGTLIRCGNLIFKIIEVNDDNIRVATVCMLSQQNQKDMMGFLKQYLSAAQIAKFIGQPELLDADEIAEFFGDNRAHIAFYAAKDLFEKN